MKKVLSCSAFVFILIITKAQLIIQSGTNFTIQGGAKVIAQGDVSSNADISGSGVLLMKGTVSQAINMNGFTVFTGLELDNTAHVNVTGNSKLAGNLAFTNGKLVLGNNIVFTLTSTGSFSGAGSGKFAETIGSSEFRKEPDVNASYILPIGYGIDYHPLEFQLNGTTLNSSSYIGARVVNNAHPNKHILSTDYLNRYWTISKANIAGGTVFTVGTYNDAAGITGAEADIRGITWNGTNWNLSGASINTSANLVTTPFSGNSLDVYAMNRFVLMRPKVLLQGPYNSTTGLMDDYLRGDNGTTPNLIPLTEPYGSAPYSFTRYSGTAISETAAASVFNNNTSNPENEIVDWIFLQLRNTAASPANTIIQTRSALLQADGDIVDIDGFSPVYFKNVDGANYNLTVKHRNHLSLSTDVNNYTQLFNESSAAVVDFRTLSDAQLFGTSTAFANASHPLLDTVNVLWGGDASGNYNNLVRSIYTNPGNDKDAILAAIGGVTTGVITDQYRREDLNMDRNVRYTNPGNDKDFLLQALGGATSGVRVQQVPLPVLTN